MHKTERYGTPYDAAFKTMLEKFPQLIIPIINEQFNKNYALNEKVEFIYAVVVFHHALRSRRRGTEL